MKYLIYELHSKVGFCNQLFSLESAIYIANISNRKLVLLIRYPLAHCGKASWKYGHFLDFFNDNYKHFLPKGLKVYYRKIPDKIKERINSENNTKVYRLECSFSSTVFIESKYSNYYNVDNFCNGRTKFVIDFDNIKNKYIYINKSNASRCFYNFYTSQERYKLMSDICYSLTNLKLEENIHLNNHFDLSIHLRLGDYHISKNNIDDKSNKYMEYLFKIIKKLNVNDILVMCDRKDGAIIDILKTNYNITFTDDLIKKTNNPVQNFLLEKKLCESSKYFIGTITSTVSNYINYKFYLNNKVCNMYNKTIIRSNSRQYSWCLNKISGNSISWTRFWTDNIYKPN